jgi:type VI protein secretion system component Hcp
MTAVVAFLKLTDDRGVNLAPGDATEKGYAGWMALYSYTPFDPVPRGSGTGAGVGPMRLTKVSIIKPVDNSTAALIKTYTSGGD